MYHFHHFSGYWLKTLQFHSIGTKF